MGKWHNKNQCKTSEKEIALISYHKTLNVTIMKCWHLRLLVHNFPVGFARTYSQNNRSRWICVVRAICTLERLLLVANQTIAREYALCKTQSLLKTRKTIIRYNNNTYVRTYIQYSIPRQASIVLPSCWLIDRIHKSHKTYVAALFISTHLVFSDPPSRTL